MAADVRTPSEIVYLHASRFADFCERDGFRVADDDVGVDRDGLACAMVLAALVANHRDRVFSLRAADVSSMFGLLTRRGVEVDAGSVEPSWPSTSLEQQLALAVRDALEGRASTPLARVWGRSRLARAGARGVLTDAGDALRSRGEIAAPDVSSLREVEGMLSDFRAADPRLALWVRRSVHAALSTRGREGIVAPFPILPRRPPRTRRDEQEVDLSDWDRLNRNPPSATDPKR